MEVFESYLCSGSDHVREKDGVWAALCWLQVWVANWPSPYLSHLFPLLPTFTCSPRFCNIFITFFQILAAKRCSVEDLLTSHWKKVWLILWKQQMAKRKHTTKTDDLMIWWKEQIAKRKRTTKTKFFCSMVGTFSPDTTMKDVPQLPVNRWWPIWRLW